jgi:hypothetical protein
MTLDPGAEGEEMVQVPQQISDLEQAEENLSRRAPGIVVVAVGGAVWVIMAIVGVVILRPELALVRQMAVRVATGSPVISPQGYAQEPALPSPSPTASVGATQPPAGWLLRPAMTSPGTTRASRTPGAHTATGKATTRSTPTPTPGKSATPSPTATSLPTSPPTGIPTSSPTGIPTDLPTSTPTDLPTSTPTGLPSSLPTDLPSSLPTDLPTSLLTDLPTSLPALLPVLP